MPVPLQEAYRDLGPDEGDFAIAEECAREVLSLPMYPVMTEEIMICVADLIRRF